MAGHVGADPTYLGLEPSAQAVVLMADKIALSLTRVAIMMEYLIPNSAFASSSLPYESICSINGSSCGSRTKPLFLGYEPSEITVSLSCDICKVLVIKGVSTNIAPVGF